MMDCGMARNLCRNGFLLTVITRSPARCRNQSFVLASAVAFDDHVARSLIEAQEKLTASRIASKA